MVKKLRSFGIMTAISFSVAVQMRPLFSEKMI
nr:MAG TPA: cyanate lyase [Caudoviricetes sp.]